MGFVEICCWLTDKLDCHHEFVKKWGSQRVVTFRKSSVRKNVFNSLCCILFKGIESWWRNQTILPVAFANKILTVKWFRNLTTLFGLVYKFVNSSE